MKFISLLKLNELNEFLSQVRLDYHPLRGWREIKKTDWYYGEHRPWTAAFQNENFMKKHKKYYVQPLKRFPVYKGDRVCIFQIS